MYLYTYEIIGYGNLMGHMCEQSYYRGPNFAEANNAWRQAKQDIAEGWCVQARYEVDGIIHHIEGQA